MITIYMVVAGLQEGIPLCGSPENIFEVLKVSIPRAQL